MGDSVFDRDGDVFIDDFDLALSVISPFDLDESSGSADEDFASVSGFGDFSGGFVMI